MPEIPQKTPKGKIAMTDEEILRVRIKVLRAEMKAYAETVWRRLDALEAKYSPDQPRDDHGRWTDGGGSGTGSSKPSAGDILNERVRHPHSFERIGTVASNSRDVPALGKHLDTNRAAQHAADNIYDPRKFPHGRGKCATKVREAVEAGLGHPIPTKDLPPIRKWFNPRTEDYEETRWARDYGDTFEKAGLSDKIAVAAGTGDHPPHYQPKIGDVAVIQPTSDPKHPEGHTAIYTREGWVSDYKQGKDLYPNSRYRSEKPSYTIYRKPE